MSLVLFLPTIPYLALNALAYAMTLMCLVVAIAFYTVLERKVLASIQRRRGPNVAGIWGLGQAFADGVKLLLKEPLMVSGANFYIFLLSPVILLAISLTIWAIIPLPGAIYNASQNYSFLVVFLFSGLNSYAIILAGLTSNSRYSLVGGVRAIAQVISYEIPLSISILALAALEASFNILNFAGSKIIFTMASLPIVLIFLISLLAETNRTPFDLPEAEAELVAGYNLEYSSILFSLFFLAEYSNILVASSLLSYIFFNTYFYISVIFFSIAIVVLRGILPRYTYKQLISLCWKVLFPASVAWLTITVVLIFFIDSFHNQIADPAIVEAASSALDGSSTLIHAQQSFYADGRLCVTESFAFWKVLLFFFLALGLSAVLVSLNWIIVYFNANARKNSPYECGFEPLGSPISNFEPNFVAVALAFLIYDVEILLTYPWVMGMKGQPAGALLIFLLFVLLLLLSYVYEVLDGAFDI